MHLMHQNNSYGNPPKLFHLRVKSLLLVSLLIVLSFSLVGCVSFNDPEASQEYNSDIVGILNSQSVIGQSFISRRPNLDGITIWITPSGGQDAIPGHDDKHVLNIKLFNSESDTLPVFITNIVIPASGNISPLTIQIPNQHKPANELDINSILHIFKHHINSWPQ